jgi:predicted transcriptional regulator
MARLRLPPEESADEVFRKELRMRQGYYDLMTQTDLAKAAGIPQPTLSKRLANPENLSVAELRKLVDAVEPDPKAVLTLLGYSSKQIKRFLSAAV